MKITLEKNGNFTVTSKTEKVSVVVTSGDIYWAVKDLLEVEIRRIANNPETDRSLLKDIIRVEQEGISALGLNHPTACLVVKHAAVALAETAFE
jgi:hypothetical protein